MANHDQIVVGKLNRISKALREELSHGASLRACRNALEDAGHSWRLLSGTLVFVHPWQYRAAVSALSLTELRPYHIVFAESLGYLLEETMAHCKGSWMAACSTVHEHEASASQIGDGVQSATSNYKSTVGEENGDANEGSEKDTHWVVSVVRTF